MGRLDGKTAIVTGSARGTGAATARLMAREGARVVLADVLDDAGEAVAKEIGERASYAHLDVTSESDWQRVVERCCDEHGGVDVLVNNAGVIVMAALLDTSLADFERIVKVNQVGTFLGIKSVAPAMRERGRGSIVNVSSIDGQRGANGLVAYSSSKWAVRGITRVAALELGAYGIRVNAVCPEAGGVDMVRGFIPDGVDAELAMSFQQPRLAYQKDRSIAERVGDVANMILFLASDESLSCTGADFTVDGGNTAGKFRKGLPGSGS